MAGKAAAGAADVRDGGSSGLPADPDEPLYFQGSAGVPGTAETGDQFAAAPVRLTWRRPRPRDPVQAENDPSAAARRWGSRVRRWVRARSISRS